MHITKEINRNNTYKQRTWTESTNVDRGPHGERSKTNSMGGGLQKGSPTLIGQAIEQILDQLFLIFMCPGGPGVT